MIVEERIYSLIVGKVPEYLELYREFGLAVQSRILGHMVGYYSSEIGSLNQVVHLWAYEDLDDRSRRRAELLSNPEWRAYTPKIRPLVISQENRILIPASFAPVPKVEIAL